MSQACRTKFYMPTLSVSPEELQFGIPAQWLRFKQMHLTELCPAFTSFEINPGTYEITQHQTLSCCLDLN